MEQPDSFSLDERVRASVGRYLGVPETRLLDTALLGDDLCVDSLMAAEMVTVVEDDLDVRLGDDVLDGVSTYGDFARSVRRQVETAPATGGSAASSAGGETAVPAGSEA